MKKDEKQWLSNNELWTQDQKQLKVLFWQWQSHQGAVPRSDSEATAAGSYQFSSVFAPWAQVGCCGNASSPPHWQSSDPLGTSVTHTATEMSSSVTQGTFPTSQSRLISPWSPTKQRRTAGALSPTSAGLHIPHGLLQAEPLCPPADAFTPQIKTSKPQDVTENYAFE